MSTDRSLEGLIPDDEVLRVGLDLRDVWLNRYVESQNKKCREELKVDGLMGETQAAGAKVAEDLLYNVENIVDAETCEEGTSDATCEAK